MESKSNMRRNLQTTKRQIDLSPEVRIALERKALEAGMNLKQYIEKILIEHSEQ
jgi:hypothetical protein